MVLTSLCWWDKSRGTCCVYGGGKHLLLFALLCSSLGHHSVRPTAGSHLPNLAQAQEVRREAVLCPAGGLTWPGVRQPGKLLGS